MRTTPTSRRLTAANVDEHWAIKYVKLERCGRSAHRMTRATLRRHRADQHRASKIRVQRPLQPVWLRMVQTAATWVF
jgi:hypothetical protein